MHVSRSLAAQFFRDNLAQGTSLQREMLWGYFFIAKVRSAAAEIRARAVAAGFRFVDTWKDGKDIWVHVERVETLSPDALAARCGELEALADDRGVVFDGFDVGNVDGSALR